MSNQRKAKKLRVNDSKIIKETAKKY